MTSSPGTPEKQAREVIDRHRYWAIVANPTKYRIEAAARELETDTWSAPRGDIKPGDRIAFWRTRGSDRNRGVVALGDVLSEPQIMPETEESEPYWIAKPEQNERRRIRVRYVVPPRAPLWVGADGAEVLETLSVFRATGGGVYKITASQWRSLVDALGGWPADAMALEEAVSQAAQDAAEEAAARARGQGFITSPERRKAIELHAMAAAKAFFKDKGYGVIDTSAHKPYDLVARKGGEKKYVEVKGTTGGGEQVIITRGEVEHARGHRDQMVLFILHGIDVEEGEDGPLASGGTRTVLWPWDVDGGELRALSFSFRIRADV